MTSAERDVLEFGMGQYRWVNALAVAAEWVGSGFAMRWAEPQWAADEWDDITRVVFK